MKKIIFFLFLFLLFSTYSISQTTDSISINYDSLEYEIINRDTNSITVTDANSDSSWIDTTIFAHIIFPNLSIYFNRELLKNKINQVMLSENIQNSYVWRDKNSLGFLAISFRSDEMKKVEKKSFVSWVKINKENKIEIIKWGLKD